MTPSIEPLRITVLGSGTSVGVPTLGCRCDVCRSGDPRDKRLRPSVLLRYNRHNVLVDTTPDFRYQALRAGIERVDAVLFTHAHADHIMGLDDIRPFNFQRRGHIPIFGSAETMAVIRRCFEYVFNDAEKEKDTPIPRLEIRTLDGTPFELFDREVMPVPLMHGKQRIYGFRIGQAAYLTDHSSIPEESFELLRGLDVLFLDALRHRPHPTHSTVERSIGYVEKLAPRRAFLTHICHDLPHARTEETLPPNVRLAYDGLELVVEEDR